MPAVSAGISESAESAESAEPTVSAQRAEAAVSRASRFLFVHAHPDDESLTCGIAMAHHGARGDEVHVLTCTLGEEGEVIPPRLAHLEGDTDDALGLHRHGELTEALRRVGATMHVLVVGDDDVRSQPADELCDESGRLVEIG